MMTQLDAWKGDFGDAYTERNPVDWRNRVKMFEPVLARIRPASVLEIGCNRGHNLGALHSVLGDGAELVAVEPNQRARAIARSQNPHAAILAGNALDLPFKDGTFELVFTSGVLIHVSLADLPRAMDEIHRTARRYILAVEYFAESETPIPYRGRGDLLWKRNFRKHYLDRFPHLTVIGEGYADASADSDGSDWWLFEKPRSASD